MEQKFVFLLIAFVLCVVSCQPLDRSESVADPSNTQLHKIWKRFVNPSLSFGQFSDSGIGKIRAKRSYAEECEKLELCKLHARSGRNFFAAFELYFVNKENARLWDHRAHTEADCERRFNC